MLSTVLEHVYSLPERCGSRTPTVDGHLSIVRSRCPQCWSVFTPYRSVVALEHALPKHVVPSARALLLIAGAQWLKSTHCRSALSPVPERIVPSVEALLPIARALWLQSTHCQSTLSPVPERIVPNAEAHLPSAGALWLQSTHCQGGFCYCRSGVPQPSFFFFSFFFFFLVLLPLVADGFHC
ncbi:hypothetical protein AMTR_s00096p00057970 [Amborella trichopoda]|uniref:Uncharacterized protein n=1 Tax=Amborella trichopoda TaxID=13333 RepID=W1P3Y9_AMBTC|nr:hypothetical protein AMTR_s00096p00057970 [Amborella trichopoda]